MSEHLCHRPNCGKPVPPRLVVCSGCWFLLPLPLRNAIWKFYRPGQEIRKDPTLEYIAALKACLQWWSENAPLPERPKQRTAKQDSFFAR